MRRFLALGGTMVALLIALLGLVPSLAGAATCSSSGSYPPGACSVSTNTTVVTPGGTFTVTTSAVFTPGESVVVTINGTIVATFTANARGIASGTVTVPANTPAGTAQLVLTGRTSGQVVSTTIDVVLPAAAAAPPTNASLPFTGAVVFPVLGAGGGLLVAGGVLLFVLRRRRPAAVTS